MTSPVPPVPRPLIFALAALLVGGLLGGLIGYNLNRPPGDTSPEAGFARDMQAHHNQAVEMSLIVREKSTDPVLRAVAYDITTSQQQQSGQMFGWLTQWGLPQTSSEPAMAWMPGHEGHGGAPGTGHATMPGMATREQIQELEAATGVDAEILYLQLMTTHHVAGVEMAEAIIPLTERDEVDALATSMATAQKAEIDLMADLLRERGIGG